MLTLKSVDTMQVENFEVKVNKLKYGSAWSTSKASLRVSEST